VQAGRSGLDGEIPAVRSAKRRISIHPRRIGSFPAGDRPYLCARLGIVADPGKAAAQLNRSASSPSLSNISQIVAASASVTRNIRA
jgi:hypothetical protein